MIAIGIGGAAFGLYVMVIGILDKIGAAFAKRDERIRVLCARVEHLEKTLCIRQPDLGPYRSSPDRK